jgi:hypothetical protein
MTEIQKDTLQKLVRVIADTRSEEFDCDLCLDQLEKFVELEMENSNAADTYPLLKHHLDSCVGCGEEYKALVDALDGLEAPIS